MLLFWNLFGSNQNLCVLKQNLLHLSNNYVIKPIIMCARNNTFLPTSRCYSVMKKLCCFAAILCWFQHITKLRVPNIDSIIIFSAFKLFFGINSQWMPVTHLLALIVPASMTSTNHSFVIVIVCPYALFSYHESVKSLRNIVVSNCAFLNDIN